MKIEPQSISKTRISAFSKLAKKKYRDRELMFAAEGRKCVADTLGHFELVELVATREWIEKHEELAAENISQISVASDREMEKLTQLSSPPDVIAFYRYPNWFVKAAEGKIPLPEPETLYLALDGVQDPGNLGTIVRTADWFGVKRIYASRQTADIFSAKAIQATMGSIGRVEVIYCELPELIRKSSLPVFGTLLDGDNIYNAPFSGGQGIVVFGNEGNGLTEEVRKLVTNRLFIPPYPANSTDHPESLNVGISSAIVLSEFRRRSTVTHSTPQPLTPVR